VVSAHLHEGVLRSEFAPDSHHGEVELRELSERARTRPRLVATWDAAEIELPWHDYHAVTQGERALLSFLSDCDTLGFSLLRGVPLGEGTVAEIVSLFGYVRVTNYGERFDVRTVVDPLNLANTSLSLGAHTDNPYRSPTPTLQLLHCLNSSLAGGVNALVDGYRVANELRTTRPGDFEILANTPVRFRYRDRETDLETWAPIVGCDVEGRCETIRFNTRSALPAPTPAHRVGAWYEAYLSFAELLADPRFVCEVSLRPGDLILFDNRRILHGRSGYDANAGARHLQGCYADVDSLRSTIAVLERSLAH
jgi:gamma-butyrobetaine dioxygenase